MNDAVFCFFVFFFCKFIKKKKAESVSVNNAFLCISSTGAELFNGSEINNTMHVVLAISTQNGTSRVPDSFGIITAIDLFRLRFYNVGRY